MDEQISAIDRALMLFMGVVMFFGILSYLTGKSAPEGLDKFLGIGLLVLSVVVLLIAVKPNAPAEKRKNQEKRKNEDILSNKDQLILSEREYNNFTWYYIEYEDEDSGG